MTNSAYPSLTTLKTVATAIAAVPSFEKPQYPVPSGTKAPVDELPPDPNFPWGKDSPVYRHGNRTELGIGIGGDMGPRSGLQRRWENAIDRIKSMWSIGKAEAGEDAV